MAVTPTPSPAPEEGQRPLAGDRSHAWGEGLGGGAAGWGGGGARGGKGPAQGVSPPPHADGRLGPVEEGAAGVGEVGNYETTTPHPPELHRSLPIHPTHPTRPIRLDTSDPTHPTRHIRLGLRISMEIYF